MATIYNDRSDGLIERRFVALPGSAVDHDAERDRLAATRSAERLKAERREADLQSKIETSADARLKSIVNRLLKQRMAPQLAERGDIDDAFVEWKRIEPRAFALAALETIEAAVAALRSAPEIAIGSRFVDVPPAVIGRVAEQLRHMLLATLESKGGL